MVEGSGGGSGVLLADLMEMFARGRRRRRRRRWVRGQRHASTVPRVLDAVRSTDEASAVGSGTEFVEIVHCHASSSVIPSRCECLSVSIK